MRKYVHTLIMAVRWYTKVSKMIFSRYYNGIVLNFGKLSAITFARYNSAENVGLGLSAPITALVSCRPVMP